MQKVNVLLADVFMINQEYRRLSNIEKEATDAALEYTSISSTKEEGAVCPHGYDTFMSCVECTAMKGGKTLVYFCINTKKAKPCLCHWRYYVKHHSVTATSTNVEVVLQEGTTNVEVVVESGT
eukprot:6672568-Ditylum_brightwellii.AAC.1